MQRKIRIGCLCFLLFLSFQSVGCNQQTKAEGSDAAGAMSETGTDTRTDTRTDIRNMDEVREEESTAATMQIYDIEEGYLTVPFHEDIRRHPYDWDQIIERGGYRYYRQEGKPESRIGIDVSYYQGDIDWTQVKESGIDFAIIRLGYRGYESGGLRLDKRFHSYMEGANAAGLNLGVYFFSQAINEAEAKEEADFVLEQIQNQPITMPVVFDTEKIKGSPARTDGLTVEELTAITDTFCSEIKAKGYVPMIYANAKWLSTKLDLKQLEQYVVWYADYQERPLYRYDFLMWQYTETGMVPGIQGNVDLNIYFSRE